MLHFIGIKVRSILPIFDRDAKNFQWYFKWISDVKTVNLSKSELDWTDEIADLQDLLKERQIKELNSYLYPNANFLNKNYRYVSGITYDCVNAVWNRIVSVPFMYPNGEIRQVVLFAKSIRHKTQAEKNLILVLLSVVVRRGVVAVSISLNNFDLKQCDAKKKTDDDDSINVTLNKQMAKESDPFLGTHRCDPVTTVVGIDK